MTILSSLLQSQPLTRIPGNGGLSNLLLAESSIALDDAVNMTLPVASGVSLLIVVILLVTRSYWRKGRTIPATRESDTPVSKPAILLLSLVVPASAFLGFPRLQHSLWTDEQVALRKSIIGQFTHDPELDGQVESLSTVYWEEAEWAHTLWYYENPNPHFLLDITARLSHQARKKITGSADWEFSEFSLRIIPFLCGLLAIPAWFLCIHRIGYPRSALLAAFLIALHPWFIRTITEARGYPLALLIMPLWLLAARAVLRTDRWKHWLCFGIAQILLLYSWPGMIAFVAATNILLFLNARHLCLNKRRWALTNILSATLLFQLTAPCFAQIGGYLGNDALSLPVGTVWFKDLATRFLAGMDWHDHFQYSQENPAYINLASSPAARQILLGILALTAVASFFKGIHLWWKNSPFSRVIVLASIISFFTIYIPAAILGVFIFQSYMLFLLPVAIALCATGLTALVDLLSKFRLPAIAVAATLFLLCTWPVTSALRTNTLDPIREAALTVRESGDPLAPGQNRIITAFVGLTARAYDPFGWPIDSAAGENDDPWPGLTQLMKYADLLDRELHVHLAFPQTATREFPDIVRMLHTPELFEKTHTFLGLEPQYKREIYHYKGGMFDWMK